MFTPEPCIASKSGELLLNNFGLTFRSPTCFVKNC